MEFWKRLKPALFVDNGLMLGVVLITICAFTWARFVDWSGPADDLAAQDRARLEGCIMAERSLGDSVYRERPDCRAILQPLPLSATIPTTSKCAPGALRPGCP